MSDLFTQVGADASQPEAAITTYNFNGSTPVRVVKDESGEPWFVAKDVCDALELGNPSQAVSSLDEEERSLISNEAVRNNGPVVVVDEGGLYTLTLRCRDAVKPGTLAYKFRKWVTHEVLPAIRRDGGYVHAAPDDPPEVIMAKALKVADATMKRQKEQLEAARATIAQKDQQLELAAPKVAFVETFATSTTGNILVRDFAGMVSRSLGMRGFGQSALFKWLKDNGYMNLNRYPSQRSNDMKLLDSTEGFHVHHDGTTGVHHCTRITPKGQTYFFGKIKEQYEAHGRWW